LILAIIYFLIFCFILKRHSFFKDDVFSYKHICVILIIKAIACFAFYWVYFSNFTKNFTGDSASTLADAKIMFSALPNHPMDFFKMVFGLHSDSDFDPLYKPYFEKIEKWGKSDVTSDFFLNDNRTPIRLNAFIMMFSNGNYAVHALFMLMMSFVGQFTFYKAFKKYFPKKEWILLGIIFLTPSILFWTSGVLKEPIAVCLLGLFFFCYLKIAIECEFKIKYVLVLITSSLLFLIIKPYILILCMIPLMIWAIVKHLNISVFNSKKIVFIYAFSMISFYMGSIVFIQQFFHKNVIKTIVVRQNDFINLSNGGTFFSNSKKYVRFDFNDSTHYEKVKDNIYKLKPHASFMYWDPHNLRDTIFENDNADTSKYLFISRCDVSGSAISMERLQYTPYSFLKIIPKSFMNVLAKPFFYDSRSILELMASVENLCFLMFFIFCFIYRTTDSVNKNLLLFCMTLFLTSFLLIGLTTTVLGAIVRYRIPFLPFFLMIPLLYLDINRVKNFRIFRIISQVIT